MVHNLVRAVRFKTLEDLNNWIELQFFIRLISIQHEDDSYLTFYTT